MACLESLQIVRMNTEQSHPRPRVQNKESGIGTGYGGGMAQPKPSKKWMPFSSECQKLQKVDLSLEAYVQVLLSVEHGQQPLRRKCCSLQNLRKVLSANNFASSKATKECITQNLHQLPLFKPFFSSLSGSSKDLQVDAIAMKHTEVVEDLHALEWLEYGQFHVELEAECILGISAEQTALCLSSECQKRDSCWPKSCAVDKDVPSGHNQLYNPPNLKMSHRKDNLEPQVSTSEWNNAIERPCLPQRINWGRQLKSSYSRSHVECLEFRPSSVSNSYATYGKTITKDICDLVIPLEPDPCDFVASAIPREADTPSQPCATRFNTGKELQEPEVCPSAESNKKTDSQATEGFTASDKLLTVHSVNRKIVQAVSSMTLVSESPELTYHPVQEPFPLQINLNRHEDSPGITLQHAAADVENREGNLPYVLESPKAESVLSMSGSTSLLDEVASQFLPSGYSLNVGRKGAASVVVNGIQSPLKLDMAIHKVAELPCSEQFQLGSVEDKKCKESESRASSCQSANLQDFPSDCKETKAEGFLNANSTPEFKMAARVNPAETASGMKSGRAADVRSGLSLPFLANESSNVAPSPPHRMEPSNFGAASAGLLEVLSGGVPSRSSSGGPSACYEDSLDLLERWRKRRQPSSDTTDRMMKSSKVHHLAGMASKMQRIVHEEK